MKKEDFTELKDLFKRQTLFKKIVFIPIVIACMLWTCLSFVIYCIMWLMSFLCIQSQYVRSEIADNIKHCYI